MQQWFPRKNVTYLQEVELFQGGLRCFTPILAARFRGITVEFPRETRKLFLLCGFIIEKYNLFNLIRSFANSRSIVYSPAGDGRKGDVSIAEFITANRCK